MKEKQSRANDWEVSDLKQVSRRLEALKEERKKILKERAKALAHKLETGETADKCIEILEFLLADERYGIEPAYVREVYPFKELTPLPCTPPFVLGIISVRGQILSVIDIKKFFDLPERGLTNLNKIIILHTDTPVPTSQGNEAKEPILRETGGMEFGIPADAILGTRAIPLREIQPSLPTLTGIRKEYLKGVTREQLVILDGEKLLSDKKIVVNEEA